MTTDTRQTATHPTGADLKPFGYAPGGYMVRCRHCDAIRADLDKRAWSCRSCAVEQWQARQSAPPTQTAQPLPAAIETDIGDLYALCKATEIATAWGIAASLRAAITTAIAAAERRGIETVRITLPEEDPDGEGREYVLVQTAVQGEMYGIEYFPERFVAAIRSLKETDNDPA